MSQVQTYGVHRLVSGADVRLAGQHVRLVPITDIIESIDPIGQRRVPQRQISKIITRFTAGAKMASVGRSGSGNTSSIRFQGKPNGTKKTPARGPDELPKRPKVPTTKSPAASTYRTEKPITTLRQARCIKVPRVSPAPSPSPRGHPRRSST